MSRGTHISVVETIGATSEQSGEVPRFVPFVVLAWEPFGGHIKRKAEGIRKDTR